MSGPLDTTPQPVNSIVDVQSEWAADLQTGTNPPVLTAIQAGQTAMLEGYQDAQRYAAAQSDPLRATGEYEDIVFAERGFFRQTASGEQPEDDTSFRTRSLSWPLVVDPNDIISVANAVLAPYNPVDSTGHTVSCRYAEASDGWYLARDIIDQWQASTAYVFGQTIQPNPANGCYYMCSSSPPAVVGASAQTTGASPPTFPKTTGATVSDGTLVWTCMGPVAPGVSQGVTPVWSSHLFSLTDVDAGAVPNYPDRYYPDNPPSGQGAVVAGATSVPNRRPPGAMLNPDTSGRWFLLRAPDVSGVDGNVAAIYDSILDSWAASTTFAFGQRIQPATPNGFGYLCSSPGVSSSSPPNFPTVAGQTVTDGSVVWTCLGPAPFGPLPNSDGFFLGSGTNTADQNCTFLFNYSATADEIYNSLANAVSNAVGQGVRWTMIVDPTLTA